MARSRLVAGNWKMHGSRASIAALLDALVKENRPHSAVCVPYPYLAQVAERLRGSAIAWGAQNVSEHAQGAYTGEVSAAMLKEFGCRYAIVGHSERRQLYGETDAQVAAKFAAARSAGITPILYGGSVKPQNAPAIFAMPDVDGGLIGGASLVANDFLEIVKALNT